MESDSPTSDQKTEPFYSITDLSLDIQEIINSELKRDTKKDNSWLCFKCGVLNSEKKKLCICGEPNNIENISKDNSSDSESSFEIINEENEKINQNVNKEKSTDCDNKNKEIEIWLCSFCGKASSNKNCCQDLFQTNNGNKNDNFSWECAWCYLKNNENYTKCKDCGHLRLDTTPTKVLEPIQSEAKNCWDPRKWFIKVSDTDIKEQNDFSLNYIGEKPILKMNTDSKILKDIIPEQDGASTDVKKSNEISKNLKSLEMVLTSTDSKDKDSVDITDSVINDVKNKNPFESLVSRSSNEPLCATKTTGVIKKKVRFDEKFLTNYTLIGNDLVLVERKCTPGGITMDMLQNALKSVTISNQEQKNGKPSQEASGVKQNQYFKTSSSTQTETSNGAIQKKYPNNNNNSKQNKPIQLNGQTFTNTKWKCVQCKLINPPSTKFCFICHRARTENHDIETKKIETIISRKPPEKIPQKVVTEHKQLQASNASQLDQFTEFANSIVKDTSNQVYIKIQKQKNENKHRKPRSRKNKINNYPKKIETYNPSNNSLQVKKRQNQKKNLHENRGNSTPNDRKGNEIQKDQKLQSKPTDFCKIENQMSDSSLLLDSKSFDLSYTWTCQYCKLINPGNVEICSGCKTDSLVDLSEIYDEKNNLRKSSSTIEILQKFLGQEIAQTAYQKPETPEKNQTLFQISSQDNQPQTNEANQPQNIDKILESGWRCKICTFVNQAFLKQCRICQNGDPQNKEPTLTKLNISIEHTEPQLQENKEKTGESSSTNSNSEQEANKPNLQKSTLPPMENQNDSQTTWNCKKCMIKNSAHIKNCIVCGLDRIQTETITLNIPNKSTAIINDQNTLLWTCDFCTAENSKNLQNCSQCNIGKTLKSTSKDVTLGDQVRVQNSSKDVTLKIGDRNEVQYIWNCNRCTIENSENVSHCKGCGYDQSGTYKPIQNISSPSRNNSNFLNKNWICKICTLVNSIDSDKCTMCANSRIQFDSTELKNKSGFQSSSISSKWKCHQCTFVNDRLLKECAMCGLNKNPNNSSQKKEINVKNNTWICKICTLQNPEQEKQCSACGNVKDFFSNDNLWKCPKCTYENAFMEKFCSMCNTNRVLQTQDVVEGSNGNSWRCGVCTLENSSNNENCSACDTERTLSTTNLFMDSPIDENFVEIQNWTCQNCTFENLDDDKCSACNTDRITNESSNIIIGRNKKTEMGTMETDYVDRKFDLSSSTIEAKNITFTSSEVNLTTDSEKSVPKKVNSVILSNSNETVLLNHWRCTVCTFINVETLTECRTCKTNRYGSQKIEKSSENSRNENTNCSSVSKMSSENKEDQWKCSLCTLLNSGNSKECRACYTERVIEEKAETKTKEIIENNSEEIWNCQFCNAQNKPEYNQCRSCHKINFAKLPFSPEEDDDSVKKWQCLACTYFNADDKIDCSLCGHSRIRIIDCDTEPPESSKKKSKAIMRDNSAYLELVEASNAVLMPNQEMFYCIICMTNCNPGEGVVLSECLHQFCRDCLKGTISNGEEQGAHIVCPYVDDEYRCQAVLTERELRHLVDEDIYERHLDAALREAKAILTGNGKDHVYQCRTADCIGWCIYEDGVNEFWCQACYKINCLNCQAIHDEETCAQYQDRIQTEARTNDEARQTNEQLQNLLASNEAMKCPNCGIILAKRSGCDWLVCSSCRTEICWATRGPRWGPNGRGDTSGGCRCRENGQLCHPQCGNCH